MLHALLSAHRRLFRVMSLNLSVWGRRDSRSLSLKQTSWPAAALRDALSHQQACPLFPTTEADLHHSCHLTAPGDIKGLDSE